MEELPYEIRFAIWRKLSIENILDLCETNKDFKGICDDNRTWQFLLKRDFNFLPGYPGDAKIKYITEYTKDKVKKAKVYILVDTGDASVSYFTCIDIDINNVYKLLAHKFNTGSLDAQLTLGIHNFLSGGTSEEIDDITPGDVQLFVKNDPNVVLVDYEIDSVQI